MHIAQASFRSEQAEQRSEGYWLLSKLFLEVPTTERLLALQAALAALKDRDSPLREAIAELFTAIGPALNSPEAAVDYTRQLVALTKEAGVPLPFEAYARENRLPGDATEAIEQLLAESGYAEAACAATSPDHIGAELRLMALLCNDECEAWKNDDIDGAVASLRRQNTLLRAHLEKWAPAYCAGLAERSSSDYMRAVARLTKQALIEDVQVLAEVSNEVDALLTRPAP